MGTAAATAGAAAGSFGDYRPAMGGVNQNNTAAIGLHDHATFRERDDAIV